MASICYERALVRWRWPCRSCASSPPAFPPCAPTLEGRGQGRSAASYVAWEVGGRGGGRGVRWDMSDDEYLERLACTLYTRKQPCRLLGLSASSRERHLGWDSSLTPLANEGAVGHRRPGGSSVGGSGGGEPWKSGNRAPLSRPEKLVLRWRAAPSRRATGRRLPDRPRLSAHCRRAPQSEDRRGTPRSHPPQYLPALPGRLARTRACGRGKTATGSGERVPLHATRTSLAV